MLGAGGKNKGVDNSFFTVFFQIQKNSLTVRGHTAKIKEYSIVSNSVFKYKKFPNSAGAYSNNDGVDISFYQCGF